MLIILKQGADPKKVEKLEDWFQNQGLDTHKIIGENQSLLAVLGGAGNIDADWVRSLEVVESVQRISKPYALASRDNHPEDTVIEVGDVKIGGGNFTFFAGPCSVESQETLEKIATSIVDGAQVLRGGAFKPRTSPYAFQGMGREGIEILEEVKKETGMPIISEILDASQLPLFENVDIIQVGTRNMQNFELLKALGKTEKPIFLKRGLSSTLQEFLMSAEYILSEGNPNVILCERGIRTFETATRNTLDLSAVPLLKEQTHLPVVVDPSHACGMARLVKPMALAAAACGADGLMLEVHTAPDRAVSDASQAILPETFGEIVSDVHKILKSLQ